MKPSLSQDEAALVSQTPLMGQGLTIGVTFAKCSSSVHPSRTEEPRSACSILDAAPKPFDFGWIVSLIHPSAKALVPADGTEGAQAGKDSEEGRGCPCRRPERSELPRQLGAVLGKVSAWGRP